MAVVAAGVALGINKVTATERDSEPFHRHANRGSGCVSLSLREQALDSAKSNCFICRKKEWNSIRGRDSSTASFTDGGVRLSRDDHARA